MAEKGARERFETMAMRMYVDGQSLTAIEEAIGVSRQSLSEWKARTKRGGEEKDEWDKAREAKLSTGRRFEALLDRELRYAEGKQPGAVEPQAWNSLSQLGALVQRFQASEREAALKSMAQRSALFLDFVRDLIEFFTRQDPAVVHAIEENFDDLIAWGREKYAGNQ